MANADTPDDALTARNNGAQGIGLCRTEHMVFFSSNRFWIYFIFHTVVDMQEPSFLSAGIGCLKLDGN